MDIHISEHDVHCIATAVYVEVNMQSLEEKLGVINVIMNRVRSKRFGRDACEVVYARGQFVEEDENIVIAQPHSNSVVSYKNNDNLDLNWAITSDVVKFYDNKVGSAFQMSNGKLLLASPAVDSLDTGKLQVYNITNGFIETKLTFNNDVVKALPGPATDFSNFYVLTDDIVNFGENSRLHLVNTSGTILSTWGDNNELFHPKGLRITGNDTILISE